MGIFSEEKGICFALEQVQGVSLGKIYHHNNFEILIKVVVLIDLFIIHIK